MEHEDDGFFLYSTAMYTAALQRLRLVRQTQPSWPYIPSPQYQAFNWDLDTKDDVWFKRNIRLTKEEVRRLTPLLDIGSIHYRNRYQCLPEVALCIVCYKLSWPNRYFNMAYEFGRSITWISMVYNDTIAHLSRRYRPMLRWHPLYTKEKAEYFAEVLDKHGGCGVIWAFVDGTFRGFCRSKHAQQMDYSGYKGHGFHWQGVVGPDGILFSLTGPHLGPDNDNKLLAESGVLQKIQEFWPVEGEELFLFGDQAYGVIKGIMSPFGGDRRTMPEPEVFFNDDTSSIRISIEQAFGGTQQTWMANAFEIQQRAGASPVAAYYLVSTLLANCLTCIRGNAISSRFLTRPPTLEDYLKVVP